LRYRDRRHRRARARRSAQHLAAKTERVYDTQGAAPHTHQVTVTAAHFERLAKGERLHLVASAGDGHKHLVAITKKK
jgi:hypothetical protein